MITISKEKPYGKLSNLQKDYFLQSKFTLLVNNTEIEKMENFKFLQNKLHLNENNYSILKLPNQSSSNNKLILVVLIYNENRQSVTVMNCSDEKMIVVKNKILDVNQEKVINNKDLIFVDKIYFYFYLNERKGFKIRNMTENKERLVRRGLKRNIKHMRKIRILK